MEDICTLLESFSTDVKSWIKHWDDDVYYQLYREGAWGGPMQLDRIVVMLQNETMDVSMRDALNIDLNLTFFFSCRALQNLWMETYRCQIITL